MIALYEIVKLGQIPSVTLPPLLETAYRSGFVDSFSYTSGSRCDRSAPSELIACEGDENQLQHFAIRQKVRTRGIPLNEIDFNPASRRI